MADWYVHEKLFSIISLMKIISKLACDNVMMYHSTSSVSFSVPARNFVALFTHSVKEFFLH